MTQIVPDHPAGISAEASTLCDEIDAEPDAGLLIDIIGMVAAVKRH